MYKIKSCTILLLSLVSLAEQSPAPGQTLSDYLWEQTKEYQQQALNSSLIYGMKEKCLDPAEFGGYMVDDSVYLFKGMKSLQIAAGRENDPDLKAFLTAQAADWKTYAELLYTQWHIKNADGIAMGQAAKDYADHIRQVAENENPVYVILALTPCAKLWPWIGEQIGSGTNNFGLYTSWVKENLDPNSKSYLKYQVIVESAYKAGTVTADKALGIFTKSIQGEAKFFNSVAKCTPSPPTNTSAGTGTSPHNLLLGFLLGAWLLNAELQRCMLYYV